jgi:hypothetical protein
VNPLKVENSEKMQRKDAAKNAQSGTLPFLHCGAQIIEGRLPSENSILLRRAMKNSDIRVYTHGVVESRLKGNRAISMRFFKHFWLKKRMDIARSSFSTSQKA